MSLLQIEATGKFLVLDICSFDSVSRKEFDFLTNNGLLIDAVVATHPFHTTYFESFYKIYPSLKYYGTPRHISKLTTISWTGDISNEEILQLWEPEVFMALMFMLDYIVIYNSCTSNFCVYPLPSIFTSLCLNFLHLHFLWIHFIEFKLDFYLITASSFYFPQVSMRIPEGTEFKHPEENNRFSSVFVLHKQSKTIHNNDTIMYFDPEHLSCCLRLAGLTSRRIYFHPSLTTVGLHKFPEAVKYFKEWMRKIINDWDFENICTAHYGVLLHDGKKMLKQTLKNYESKFIEMSRQYSAKVNVLSNSATSGRDRIQHGTHLT